jgi:hypothetical protein
MKMQNVLVYTGLKRMLHLKSEGIFFNVISYLHCVGFFQKPEANPHSVSLCLFQGLVAGLRRPRPSLKSKLSKAQVAESSVSGTLAIRQSNKNQLAYLTSVLFIVVSIIYSNKSFIVL